MLLLGLVVLVAAGAMLMAPQCSVQYQALQFDMESYMQSPEPELCLELLERISAHAESCNEVIKFQCA